MALASTALAPGRIVRSTALASNYHSNCSHGLADGRLARLGREPHICAATPTRLDLATDDAARRADVAVRVVVQTNADGHANTVPLCKGPGVKTKQVRLLHHQFHIQWAAGSVLLPLLQPNLNNRSSRGDCSPISKARHAIAATLSNDEHTRWANLATDSIYMGSRGAWLLMSYGVAKCYKTA